MINRLDFVYKTLKIMYGHIYTGNTGMEVKKLCVIEIYHDFLFLRQKSQGHVMYTCY